VSKSVKPLAEKLENLSNSSNSTVSKRSRHTKPITNAEIKSAPPRSYHSKSHRIPVDKISISTGSSASSKLAASPQYYSPPPQYDRRVHAYTQEQTKKEHIDGVISNIRTETRNTFSTDMERAQDQKASKIEQIASIKMALAEEGIDTAMINTPLMSSAMEEIDSTLNLLLMKNNRYRYSSLAEEVISAGAEVLESVFDGTRTVPIVNITPDYTGYSSTVNVKLRMGLEKHSAIFIKALKMGKQLESLSKYPSIALKDIWNTQML
ncbi:unnamed protein product, partial [marine sediment metagenome]